MSKTSILVLTIFTKLLDVLMTDNFQNQTVYNSLFFLKKKLNQHANLQMKKKYYCWIMFFYCVNSKKLFKLELIIIMFLVQKLQNKL